MTLEEETRIVAAAARGDSEAFGKLVETHQRNIYNLALKLTGDPEDAMDASQDTFLRAFQNIKSFRGESRVSVWLYRLAYNASMDIIKRGRRTVPMPLSEDGEGPETDIPDPSPGPQEAAERREELEAVRSALTELPQDKREILLMREYRGMSYADISLALGIEEGTVKSRLARARASLGEILKNHGTFSGGGKSNIQKTRRKGGRTDA